MKIAVAMSGGVDSSAAAALLKTQGHELVGFTMQLWNQRRSLTMDEHGEPMPSRCCSLDDVHDARRVAGELEFPFYVLNLEKEFEDSVVKPFVQSYLDGETPIPCVACNSRLKFAALDRFAESLGCEKVATGHYARVEYDDATQRFKLLRGADAQKDQSYFLWEMTQQQLSRVLFPLGEMNKQDARVVARDQSLSIADKKESQEICFVPDGKYAEFIEGYLRSTGAEDTIPQAGDIVDTSGNAVGKHLGTHRFTLGQRRGIKIAGADPLYVLSVEPDKRKVVVGQHEELFSQDFTALRVNWLGIAEPPQPVRVMARVRYRHVPAAATVTALPDGRAQIRFDEGQRAITPGQATVWYDGDVVVGGGWIAPRTNDTK